VLPIILKTYDLIMWYVPILNRSPRDQNQCASAQMNVYKSAYQQVRAAGQSNYFQASCTFESRNLETTRNESAKAGGKVKPHAQRSGACGSVSI
jgi:hypothetical protein